MELHDEIADLVNSWKLITKYKVKGGWRHVAECMRCKDTRGFSHPDCVLDTPPHSKKECDEILRIQIVFKVMDE